MADSYSLPPIALADLPEGTKDYILGLCAADPELTPGEAVRRILDRAAGTYLPPAEAQRETSVALAVVGGLS